MNGAEVLDRLEQALGATLMGLVLLDVFLTVLYARMGTGFLAPWLARLTWRLFRLATAPAGRRRGFALSLCGPAIVALLVFAWGLGLTAGAALIIHPALGSAVTADSGETPTDFVTALYAAGSCLSVVGSSNFGPRTAGFRLLYLFNSFAGLSVMSLTLTYLMQVYTALQRRNTFALQLHLQSAETADAAEWLAALGPQGQFSGGYTNLSEAGSGMTDVKEAHHFYPVLFYFRFRDPLYGVSRSALLALDGVTLLKTGLDDGRYGWLKESAAVAQLWRGSLRLVTSLAATFLGKEMSDSPDAPGAATAERWRRRYSVGLRRLQQAGIETVVDEEAGAAAYVALRAHWDRYLAALAPAMAYSLDEIDPAGSAPEGADRRQDSRARSRSAG